MVAVVIFIYDSVSLFLTNLVENLNGQSCLDFELVIFNDGVSSPHEYFKNLMVTHHIVDVSGTPFEIRLYSLKKLRSSKYDYLIFHDSDDLMSINAVATKINYLKKFELVVSDLSTLNGRGELIQNGVWSNRIRNQFEFDYRFIIDKNIVGLGNTAVRQSVLSIDLTKPDFDPIAGDWFVFYSLIKEKSITGVFTSECQTLYRQHNENIAGVQSLSIASLRRSIAVKKDHYKLLEMDDELSRLMEIEKKVRAGNLSFSAGSEFQFFWWENLNYVII